jgi:hypothetical protein
MMVTFREAAGARDKNDTDYRAIVNSKSVLSKVEAFRRLTRITESSCFCRNDKHRTSHTANAEDQRTVFISINSCSFLFSIQLK